jgi:MFS family permease
VSAPNLAALYASRIVSGLGMGALTTVGPMAITEISPPEIRGLLTAWFNVAMGIASTSAAFCVLGVYEHVQTSRLQYQIVWFAPCIFLAAAVAASFFLCESPRWLFLVGRSEEASLTLAKLRGLPLEHPRVQSELAEIDSAIRRERSEHEDGFVGILKETFLVPANLRRVVQSLGTYGLAQLSGANSITSYFVPILTIVGVGGGTARNMFLSAMVCIRAMTPRNI